MLPKISVVTPSLNQGRYIEETIRSVLLQRYPNIEYMIIDGGSTDDTVEIIKKYQDYLAFWVSEPDDGQSHAINKGFQHATGDIFGYINSDDLYEPDAFATIAEMFTKSKEIGLVVGECQIFNDSGVKRVFKPWWPDDLNYFLKPFGSPFAQPSSFWRRELHLQVGGFDETLHYAFDRDFFLKIGLTGVRPQLINQVLARYRDHRQTKTRNTIKFYEEAIPLVKKYGRDCGLSDSGIRQHLRSIQNDIEYLRIFQIWRDSGREKALLHFLRWAILNPTFIIDRKVLGQARRLLMFREKDVAELNRM